MEWLSTEYQREHLFVGPNVIGTVATVMTPKEVGKEGDERRFTMKLEGEFPGIKLPEYFIMKKDQYFEPGERLLLTLVIKVRYDGPPRQEIHFQHIPTASK